MLATNIMWDVSDDIIFDIIVDEPPTEVEVPDDIDPDDIAGWLSDEYGYCVKGFALESEKRYE